MGSGYHTSWKVPPRLRLDPAYRAAGRRMDFAQAVYDRRSTLGWSAAELAQRAGMPEESVESIEQSGVDPTLELIEMLARALESSFRIDPRGTPGFRFEELREAEPRGAAHEEREEGTRDFRQAW